MKDIKILNQEHYKTESKSTHIINSKRTVYKDSKVEELINKLLFFF